MRSTPSNLCTVRPTTRLSMVWLLTGLLGSTSAMAGKSTAAVPDTEVSAPRAANELPKPASKIYKYYSDGTASFSDRPPERGGYVVLRYGCYACGVESTVDWHTTRLHHDKFNDEIDMAARRFRVDPALVRAVIHAESGFNAQARSPKGAVGLMQLMPATAREMGVRNARVPWQNIQGGVRYLAQLMAHFRNNITLATAAYNAGPNAVKRYAGVPPYPETQVYVKRVRILHRRYGSLPRS